MNDEEGTNVVVVVLLTPTLVSLVKILQLGVTYSIPHGESCVPDDIGDYSCRLRFRLIGAIVLVGTAA